MTSYEPLSPQQHRGLRLRSRSAADPHFVQIVASEFVAAAASAPILFTKDSDTGSFYPGAMFSFKPNEPALKSAAERGGFEPLSLQRDGFFISGERIIIDRGNPRFSETEGDPLFEESQEPSAQLRQIQRVLGQLHAGLETTKIFVHALLARKLIEPIDISLTFDDGERLTLQSLYTVSLDSLQELDDEETLLLYRAGHLRLAYTMAASLQQIRVLAQLRNRHISSAL